MARFAPAVLVLVAYSVIGVVQPLWGQRPDTGKARLRRLTEFARPQGVPTPPTQVAADTTITYHAGPGCPESTSVTATRRLEPRPVPSLIGLLESAAIDSLRRRQLDFRGHRIRGQGQLYEVIGQAPPAGSRANPGSVVVFCWIWPQSVPEVRGLTDEAATAMLADSGYRAVLQDSVLDRPDQAGMVLSQSPEPGTQSDSGTAVTITVGAFTAPLQLVPVPDLLGRSLAAARDSLHSLGLHFRVEQQGSSPLDSQLVANQAPRPPDSVEVKTAVSLSLVDPPPPPPLPPPPPPPPPPWWLIIGVVGLGVAATAAAIHWYDAKQRLGLVHVAPALDWGSQRLWLWSERADAATPPDPGARNAERELDQRGIGVVVFGDPGTQQLTVFESPALRG